MTVTFLTVRGTKRQDEGKRELAFREAFTRHFHVLSAQILFHLSSFAPNQHRQTHTHTHTWLWIIYEWDVPRPLTLRRMKIKLVNFTSYENAGK